MGRGIYCISGRNFIGYRGLRAVFVMKKDAVNNNKNIKDDRQIRCACGKLYMVRTKDGYEFKCSRCKRIYLIKYEDLIADYLTKGRSID